MGTLDLLKRHPEAGRSTVRPRVRRLVVAPCPYVVFDRNEADAVVVVAVRLRRVARLEGVARTARTRR